MSKNKCSAEKLPLSAQIAEWLSHRKIYNAFLCGEKIWAATEFSMSLCRTETPNQIAVVCGQIIFIETKKLGANLSAEQSAKHDALRGHGAIVLICDLFDEFTVKFSAIRAAVIEREKELELYD